MFPAAPVDRQHRLPPDFNIVRLDRNQIIKNIAVQALTELAISLAIGLVVCAFTASFGAVFVLTGVAIQVIFNIFIRSVGVFAAQKALEEGPDRETYLRVAKVAFAIAPWNFAVFTAMHGQTLIHEAGHALMASAVYKNANSQIQIFPFIGGSTSFNPSELSAFGKKWGASRSLMLVTAAGPLLSLAVSSISLASSFFIKDKHPRVAKYMQAAAIQDFATHATYAFSALYTSKTKLSHDFVRLATYGIHPLAATAAIIAVPILIALGAHAIKEKLEEREHLPRFAHA